MQLHSSHCLTWQYTYSLTCHCIYTAVAASRDTTLTLARANAVALRSLPHVAVLSLSYVLLQLHCITASRGTALTLSRATVGYSADAVTASRGSTLTLSHVPL